MQRLKEAAEKAKIELSSVLETEINLPFVTADASGPKHLQMKLSRSKFEQLSEALTARLRGPFEAALRDAKLSASGIDEVVLVGGATRMPMVQELVRSLTGGKEPHKGVNPDEVVAVGAALQGGVLGGEVHRRPAAGRDAADAGSGDAGRCGDADHGAQHHHPGPQAARSSARPTTTRPR